MGRLYNLTEVAKVVGVCPKTIQNWESSQLIPAASRIGKTRKRLWGELKLDLIIQYAESVGYHIPRRL